MQKGRKIRNVIIGALFAGAMLAGCGKDTSNIAEGNSRGTKKEYINFLTIARGSTSEVWNQIIICEELGYLKEEQTEKAIALCEEIIKMLNALIIKLKENSSTRAEGTTL